MILKLNNNPVFPRYNHHSAKRQKVAHHSPLSFVDELRQSLPEVGRERKAENGLEDEPAANRVDTKYYGQVGGKEKSKGTN